MPHLSSHQKKAMTGFGARHGRIRQLLKKPDAYGLKRTQSISMWLPLRMLT